MMDINLSKRKYLEKSNTNYEFVKKPKKVIIDENYGQFVLTDKINIQYNLEVKNINELKLGSNKRF